MKKDRSEVPQGKSRYAKKRESGTMMYGPGCCAHKLSPEEGKKITRGITFTWPKMS